MTRNNFILLFALKAMFGSLLFAQSNNNMLFCTYPVTVKISHGNSISYITIPTDSIKNGSYKDFYTQGQANIGVIYSFSCDSIFYYQKLSNGKIEVLGSYVLSNTLAKNDSLQMQREYPPYDLYDTVLTHFLAVRIGTWYYFDNSGNVIKQEYYPFETAKATRQKNKKSKRN